MKVLIKGAGDLASGIACRLHHCGMDVVMTEIGIPTTVRRTVAFSPAIYEGKAEVEGIEGVRCDSLEEMVIAVAERKIPVLEEVKAYSSGHGQEVPETPAQIAAVIYNSLAFCYGETVRELEEITGASYRQIHIVGGGANADYLNRLTARYTGRTVYAGPTEATAIGNLSAQMLHAGCYADLQEARNGIFHSFEIKEYQP